jgi:hypothetical protein
MPGSSAVVQDGLPNGLLNTNLGLDFLTKANHVSIDLNDPKNRTTDQGPHVFGFFKPIG